MTEPITPPSSNPPAPATQSPDVLGTAVKAWFALSQDERDACAVAASMATISTGGDTRTPPAAPKAWPATPEADIVAACALDWPPAALMVRQPNGLRYSVPSPIGASAGIGPGLSGILEQVRSGRLSWESAVSADGGLTWNTIASPECAAKWLLAEHKRLYAAPTAHAPADDGEPSLGDVADAQPTDPIQQRREAVVARLLALGFKEGEGCDTLRMFFGHSWAVPVPLPGHDAGPRKVEDMLDDAERLCRRMEVEAGAVPADLDGLAALAARGQEPTAPGPTVAELQAAFTRMEKLLEDAEADAERERKRANEADGLRIHAETDAIAERARAALCDAEAVSQRQRADAAEVQLTAIALELDPDDSPTHDSSGDPVPLLSRVRTALAVQESDQIRHLRAEKDALWGIIEAAEWIVHHCGSYGATTTLADRVLRLLPVERQRAILELQRAEAYIEVARVNARFLNPPPPERVAEYAAKVAEIEAKIAALDAGEVKG